MKIFKNILEPEYFKQVQNYYLSEQFEWYYNSDSVKDDKEKPIYQFTHGSILDGKVTNTQRPEHVILVKEILNRIKIKKSGVMRAKFNLLPRQPYTENQLKRTLHQDYTKDDLYTSLIYYINDSDGDTVVYEDDKEIKYTPRANTAIMFNSQLWHRATPPTEEAARVVLNIVFKVL